MELFKLLVVAAKFSNTSARFCLFLSSNTVLILFNTLSKEVMAFLVFSPKGERVFTKSPNKLVAGAVLIVSPDLI